MRPDAGRALEESRTGGPLAPPHAAPRLEVQEPPRPAFTAPETFRVLVKGFRITRTTIFTEDELKPLLAFFLGRELSLADLQEAAGVISRYYRDRGYFVARAYLPAQEIRDGIVEITVLEGRIGSYNIKLAPGGRVSESVVRGTLSAQQPAGSVIEDRKLQRGLLLLNDTPGIAAQATLAPGKEVGAADVTLDIVDTPLLTGNIDADNFGNRFTGAQRVGASAYLSNASGHGDLGTVRLQKSAGTESARLAYQIPVGYDGLRVGANYSNVRYELCCDFAALNATGWASDFTVVVQYPFVRARNFTASGSMSGAARHFFNSTAAGTTSDKTSRVFVLGLSLERRDDFGGAGLNAFSVAATSGQLDLDRWEPDRANDALTARTQGAYKKLNYTVSRLQRVTGVTSLYAALSGQFASKNLDSSEQIGLGGPAGVRAYPAGEAIGDEGHILNVEGRWNFAPAWQLAAFVDHGRIRLHKNEWPGWQGANATITNRYALSGAGLALDYVRTGNLVLRGVWGTRIAKNPGRSVSGNDSDNRNLHNRFWIQAVKYF